MKVAVISIWFSVVILTSFILAVTWYESHYVTKHKLATIDKLLLTEHQFKAKKTDDNKVLAVLGTSLVAHAFSTDEITTKRLNQQNIALTFHRFTILSASPSELESVLLILLDQKLDLILVDITPWLISFGVGEKFTHHRHWLSTIMAEKLALMPYRYDQKILSSEDSLSDIYVDNADKFKKFQLKNYQLFNKLTKAITHSSTRVYFYLPEWAEEARISFGLKKSKQLVENSHLFAKRYQVPLLSAPPQMSKTHYTDLVHVNRKGREEYFNWLVNTVKEQL